MGQQDVDVSCELNQLIQPKLVCEEPITLEEVPQLESNMFDDMESALNHFDNQQTSQDDQVRLRDDYMSDQDHQSGQKYEQANPDEVTSQDDKQKDQLNDQIDQSGQNEVIHIHQENSQDDQGYEVQAINITFESSDSDDDDDNYVTIEYEEGGVVTSKSWTLHTPNVA